jgi:hypothetical protein
MHIAHSIKAGCPAPHLQRSAACSILALDGHTLADEQLHELDLACAGRQHEQCPVLRQGGEKHAAY